MAGDLTGKVVYITGGTKGIGLGVAKALLAEGCRVAVSSRHAGEKIEGLEDAVILRSDVKDLISEQAAVAAVIQHFGKLDAVIANAGIGKFTNIENMEPADWQATIDTNLTGVFNTVKAGIPELKKTEGYIITMASLAGANFFENGAAYNASKFGLVGFSQAIMLDLRKHGIKVSTIMPGSVATEFNDHKPDENDNWKIQPEDIGEIVVGLLKMNPRTLPSKVEVRPSRPK